MATKKYKSAFKKDSFENLSWDQGQLVCGIDEVGRGCLAGPVLVAAVILPPHTTYRLLKDSKSMNKQELLQAHRWITKQCTFGIAAVDHRAIDAINIYHATLQAMKRALMQLFIKCAKKPSLVLVDAMPLNLDNTNYQNIDIAYFTQGESKSRSIAAASILAKVERDILMQKFDTTFPDYGLADHKGYGTQKHQAALKKQGTSIIHRKSFLSTLYTETPSDHDNQQTIC